MVDKLEGGVANRTGWDPGPADWKDDLAPIASAEWNYDRAAHLLAMRASAGPPRRSSSWRTWDTSARSARSSTTKKFRTQRCGRSSSPASGMNR